MTNEEKWIVQGRIRESYKQTKSTIATLRAEITEYAERLTDASHHLSGFANAPSNTVGPTGMTGPQYIAHFYHDLVSADIDRKVRELAEHAERLAKLEKQISEFE